MEFISRRDQEGGAAAAAERTLPLVISRYVSETEGRPETARRCCSHVFLLQKGRLNFISRQGRNRKSPRFLLEPRDKIGVLQI